MSMSLAPPPPLPCLPRQLQTSRPPDVSLLLRRRPQPKQLSTEPPPKRETTKQRSFGSTTSDVLRLMDAVKMPVTEHLYATLLEECIELGDDAGGEHVHRHMTRSGFRPELQLANRLLLAAVTGGSVEIARNVFDEMPNRDAISWAAIIFAHVDCKEYDEAMRLFVEMLEECRSAPTTLILVAVVRACIGGGSLWFGEQAHGWALKRGLTNDLFLGCTLISFYGNLKCSGKAQAVFDGMRSLNAVIWTALIAGYCNGGQFEVAFEVFKEMGRAGKKRNEYTLSSILGACGEMDDKVQHGRQIHAEAIKLGFESDPVVQSRLIGMYTRHELLQDARMVLQLMPTVESMGCWNSMLRGYIQQGLCSETIKFLYEMKDAGVKPQMSMLNEARILCGSFQLS